MKIMAMFAAFAVACVAQGASCLAHRFSFNGDFVDSIGDLEPSATGYSFVTSGSGQAVKLVGGTKGTSYVSIGASAIPTNGVSATVELWATLDSKSNYARIFETGFNNSNGFLTGMAWQRGSESSDFVFVNHGSNNKSSVSDGLSPYETGMQYHLAMVFTPCDNGTWTVRAYKQDATTGRTLAKVAFTAPANWSFPKQYQKYFYLGRTFASGDNDAAATYDELRIWTRALSERELSASASLGPDAAIADGDFPFGENAFDTSGDQLKSVDGLTAQGGIDKLGDGTLVLSGENKSGNGIEIYDGVLHQAGGSLTVSNAAVSIGAYDEKSSGRLIVSQGAILTAPAISGSSATEAERNSELVVDNASLSPFAGDLDNFGPKLLHRWSFNGNLDDSVGGLAATTNGACSYSANGKSLVLAGGTYGSSYVSLGADILPKDADAATVEIWARQDTATTGAAIFDIGINDYYFAGMRWNLQGKTSRDYIEIKHSSSKSATDKLKPYTLGTEFHIAITYYKDATNKWWATAYKQDATTGETLATTTFEAPANWSLATMYQDNSYLGHCVRSGSQDAAATYNEVRVWNGRLTEAELTASALRGPDAPEMFVEGVKGVVIGGGGMTVDTGANDVTISSPISSVCADALVHRWSFNGNLDDSVGGQTAATNGACSYSADGKSLVLAGGTRGSSYVGLGADILPKDADAATIEIWARQDTATTGAQIFDIGINDYYFAGMRWNLEGKTSRDYIEIKHNGSSKSATDQLKPYTLGTEFHIAITYYKDATNKWWATAYKQDATTGETLAKTTFEAPTNNWSLATMYQDYCYLGHSVRAGSQDAAATYNEVRVWRGMLTEEELTRNALLGPDSAFRATGVAALNKTGSGTLAIEDASSTRGKIRVAEGVLKLKSADALPQPATIEVAFDGNGGHGVLSCERGVVDLSGISLNVTGTPRGRTCIIESADGFTGKFARKSLPAGYAVDVSGTSVEVVFRGMALIVR